MRTEILKLLNKGKELHTELIAEYSGILPENIIDGGNRTISEDIPNKTNAILTILNMAEKEEKYSPINNIDDAINLFENENIQESIDKAIGNKDLAGYSPLKNKKLSAAEILENAKFGIESGVQLLSMQIMAGKLSKNGGMME
jgi:hypothetical protein